MGKEAKRNAEIRQLGKYKVKVTLTFPDNTKEEMDAHSWEDTPFNLAITYHKGSILNPKAALRIVPHVSVKYIDIESQDDEEPDPSIIV